MRRLIAVLCLTVAAVPLTASTLAPTLPSAASGGGKELALAANGPARCINLPLSSAELQPTSCWVTGPTSMVIAGVDARNAADGAVIVVNGQEKRRADLPGAGQLTIASVNGSLACVRDAVGRLTGIDTSSANTFPGCGDAPTLPAPASGGGNPNIPLSGSGGGNESRVLAASVGPAANPTPPPATTSYYVFGAYLAQCGSTATTGCPLWVDGAGTYSSSSTPSGLVILDFGAPCYNPNTLAYGTQLFNTYVCTPHSQLVSLAQAWIRGYEGANAARTTPTILGLGSSNSVTGADPPNYTLTPSQMYTSGTLWFQSLVKPVANGATGLAAPLTFWAATDIEQSSSGDWYDAATTRPWVDGYGVAAAGFVPANSPKCGATTPFAMVNFGDYFPNKPGWTTADVYYVSWGATLACALPEIYIAGWGNYWASLSNWGATHGGTAITFTGVMSEDGNGGTLTASQSWMDLYNATGQSPPYLTIIGTVATPVTPFEAPTNVTAVPGGASAIVSWTAPRLDGGRHITSYSITPYIGTTAQPTTTVGGVAPPPVMGVVNGLVNGTSYTFAVTASTSAGPGPESLKSNSVTPGDAFPYTVVTAQQYQLTGNDGASWVDLDPTNLMLTIKPQANAMAILSGNADLWTATAGINQDLGIDVNGTITAWKESGGYGGTYSPNAAFVRTTVPVTAGTTYIVKLKWKTNKPEGSAVIFTGAGQGFYSTTRLSVQLLSPASSDGVASSAQYRYPGGSGWTPIDSTALAMQYTAATSGTAVISGNADLWTAVSGYNQDLGIFVDGNLAAWKESGGYAGTYSPNAAFVLATVPLSAAPHNVDLRFKGNKPTPPNTIFAAAGPGPYSPTTLTMQFVPASQVVDATSTNQYSLASSDGSSWTAIDASALHITVNRTDNCLVTLTGNADLWTTVAGVNQDLGITVTPNDAVTYPSSLIGWKESGGYAGTFSPNAAAVEAVFAMPAGTSYTATLVWKTNKSSAGAAFAAAGQPPYSPTRLTAVLTCQ